MIWLSDILSQSFRDKFKLQIVWFNSNKRTPTQRNYDIGNCESLSHWLEGTARPFFVFMNHKYREYLRTAKAIMWEVDEQIANMLPHQVSDHFPPDNIFIPARFHSHLITWAYTTLATGHLDTLLCSGRRSGGQVCSKIIISLSSCTIWA